MKKSKIFVLIVSVLLCLTLTACSTVTVIIPYDSIAGMFANSGVANTPGTTNNDNELPANSDNTSEPDSAAPDADASETDSADVPSSDAPSSDAPSSENTTAPSGSENTTAAPESTTAAPESTTAAPTSKAPTTKDEIVAYYVSAYNKLATDGKTFTRTYDYTSNYNDILEINNNSFLEGLAKTAMNSFMKETTDAVDGTANDISPIGVTKISISPSQIGTATCNDKGNYYEVILTSTGSDSKYEEDAQPGSGSAGVIGLLLRTEEVDGKVPGVKFDGLHSWYATAKVTAKIDKASGHITDIQFYTPCVLHFDQVSALGGAIKVPNCNIGLLFQQTWNITY